ncbi:MAG TPA: hypothetical protein DIU00_20275 [Phycisphaerales bacterium]|nr:hypothetical protein [Phycisphaerales bacterium]
MAKSIDSTELDKLLNTAKELGKSWSGSWLGYHSRIYYKDFKPVPPGACFSIEWGTKETFAVQGTVGEWREYEFDGVVDVIHEVAGNPDIKMYESSSQEAKECFEESKSQLLSILSTTLDERKIDKFLQDLFGTIKNQKVLSASDFVDAYAPSGKRMSRDMIAIQAGFKTPPHISVIAKTNSLLHPFRSCEKLCKLTRRVGSHIENIDEKERKDKHIGKNVFIGHGRSKVWKDLKDFIQDRLHLPWDEFNRIPVAGVTNITRLAQLMDDAAIAFLIMTAEDEQADGEMQARMNVIHEVGLFQGRLGVEKAIVLLEDGCKEFSNISGLGQLRFPKENISAVFEEVRRVMEREGFIE